MIVTDPPPLVSCIMPTADRRRFVTRAIQYFLRQDYEPKELVIVDDGTDPINDLVPADYRIQYFRLDKKVTLGDKRNFACEHARGEIIAHWDDDDWMAGWRLSYQVENLLKNHVDICGLDSIFFYNPVSGETWKYIYPKGNIPWLAGGTLCYTKSFWAQHPFPSINIGEDARFVWGSGPKKILALPDSGFYVAFIHPGNTSPKHTRDRAWHSISNSEVQKMMGADWPHAEDIPQQAGRAPEIAVGRPETAAAAKKPLVTCLMATRDRRMFIPQSIRYFLNQDYPAKELVILDDGSESIADLVPKMEEIVYIRPDHKVTLGEKRNLGVEAGHGDVIVLWDDDDWHASHRVSYQVDPIIANRADATVLQDAILFDLRKLKFWRCGPALRDRMFAYGVIGGTAAFRKELFDQTVRFPEANLAEDAAFLRALYGSKARVLKLPCNDSFVYLRHGRNTWSFGTGNARNVNGWQPVDTPSFLPPEDLRFYESLSGTPRALAPARESDTSKPEKASTARLPLSERGAQLYRQGKYEEALDCLERAARIEGGDPWIMFDSGLCFLALHRPAEALGMLESACARIPSNTWVLSALGRTNARLGRYSAAREAFEGARKLAPDNGEATQFLDGSSTKDLAEGRRHRARGNISAALTSVDAAILKDPGNWEALLEKAALLRILGQASQAMPYMISALGLRPDLAAVTDIIAGVLAEIGHPDLAEQIVRRPSASSKGGPPRILQRKTVKARQSSTAELVSPSGGAPSLDFIKQLDTGAGSLFEDYVFMYGIVRLLRPRTIVEVGTNTGVSAIVFAKALQDCHILGKITTIDIDPVVLNKARAQVKQAQLERYIEIVEGNSLDTLPRILKVASPIDLCFLDGNHSFETVNAEFEMVRAHCRYILLHDASLFEGVKRFVEEARKRPDCSVVRLDYPPGEQWSEGRVVRGSSPGFALIEVES